MNVGSDRVLATGLGLVVVLLFGNALLSYQHTRQLAEDAAWVAHTHEALDALDDLKSTLIDAETGQRGYLITADPAYLGPHDRAVREAAGKLDRVATLTADNPAQQDRLTAVRALSAAKLDELRRTVDLVRAERVPDARQVTLTGEGRRIMDDFRAAVARMEAEEYRLLADRKADTDRAYRVAVGAGLAANLFGLIAAGLFVVLLRRHLRQRDRAAAEIHTGRELLRATLASVGDGLIATDAGGRVTFLNPVAQALTGWPPADAAGVPLEDVFHIVNEHTRAGVENPALRALKDGVIVGLANHTILIARDGTERAIEDSAAPIRDAAGAVFGAVLVFRDVTTRRQAEDRLKDESRRKDEFLALLGHELRNPLGPIRNAVRLLEMRPGDVGVVAKAGGMIDRQVAQLTKLVDELLDASRIARGKVRLAVARVDLAALARTAAGDYRADLEAAGLALTVRVPDRPAWVLGDAARLAQVLGNLLHNAAKFTPAGGRVEVTVAAAGAEAVLTVADTGVGIDGEAVAGLFEPFHQLGADIARSKGGLGLGLAVVKGLVELHGGRVGAASDGPGRGTTFTVALPLDPSPDPLPAPTGGEPARAVRGRRVVVIEDGEDTAESLRLLLELKGFAVEVAFTGPAGLDLVRRLRPDAVVCDLGLPGMSGYEVAEAVRAEPGGDGMTLVCVSGYAQEHDRQKAAAAGFDHLLAKPADPAELIRLLSR